MDNKLYRVEMISNLNISSLNDVIGTLIIDEGVAYVKLHPVKLTAKPKSESCTTEKAMHCWMESYIKGAGDFMKYLIEYSKTVSSVYIDEMDNILIKFCEQFGEVKKMDKEN